LEGAEVLLKDINARMISQPENFVELASLRPANQTVTFAKMSHFF